MGVGMGLGGMGGMDDTPGVSGKFPGKFLEISRKFPGNFPEMMGGPPTRKVIL